MDLYRKQDKTQEEIDELVKYMEKSGGLEYTKTRAREFSSFAKATLAELPETAAKRLLTLLSDFASNRTH